jgi:hypothetical protein
MLNTTSRSRRLVLAASVVVLTLTACGNPAASSPTTISSAASPAVIRVSGSGASGEAAMSASSDSKMAAPVTFVYDGDAPDLTAPAASWFFAPNPTINDDTVRTIAGALGVTGDMVTLPADQGGGRLVGSPDYTGASVTVGTDAMTSWWYSPGPGSTPDDAFGCVVPAIADDAVGVGAPDASVPSPDIAVAPPCATPQPPANVPAKAEAEQQATEFLRSIGLDPAQFVLDTYADEWGANVNAYLILDGAKSNLSVSVGYGEDGAITWASGFLATPQRGSDYPRIGVVDAVARLNDQWSGEWLGGGYAGVTGVGRAEPAIAATNVGSSDDTVSASDQPLPPTTVDPTIAEPAPVDPPAPIDPAVSEPMPIEPMPIETVPFEPVTVTLSNPTMSLEQIWAVDGTVWLLPGFAFTSDDGGTYSIIAVEDQYLDTASADVPTGDGTDPMTGSAGCAKSSIDVPAAFVADGSSLVGLCLDTAQKVAETNGFTVRVVREDGVDLAGTADYSDTRINVAVEGGVVTSIVNIG